ncbi:MAG: polysaccharide biosynthesis C-terminal domain-containing protein [Bacilli bacterium]
MRTKKVILNFLSDALPQIIIMFLGIFKIKIFLTYLGNDSLGLYQLFGKLFIYLSLLEGGIAVAGLTRLYKPVSENNNTKINEILSAIKIIFKYIAFGMIILGIFLSFFIPYMIKDNSFSNIYIQGTFILFLIMNIWSYFATANKLIFEANQRNYIINNIYQPLNILKSILEIIVVLMNFGLIGIIIVNLVLNIIINIIIVLKSKKDYALNLNNKKKDFSMLTDVKHLLVYKISGMVDYNLDILIISSMMGLKSVVIYSTYNYIIESIKQFSEKVAYAVQSSFGNLLSKEINRGYQVFMEFNSFSFYVGTIICVPLLFSINPFINIWYEGKILTSMVLAILFCLILFYMIIHIPLTVMVNALRIFKEAKTSTIMETVSNLILSIVLVNYFGIAGALLGTIISMILFEYIGRSYVIIKNQFNEKMIKYNLNNLLYLLIASISIIICYFVNKNLVYDDLFSWFSNSCLLGIISFITVSILYKLTNNVGFFDRLCRTFRKKR